MIFFIFKKKEREVEEKKEDVNLYNLAIKFLEENPGEIDLAWYARLEKMPYIPPVMKFIEWMKEHGFNVKCSKEEAFKILMKALKSKLLEKGLPE